MEGALDVLVTTPPLHHVTKSRIKSSSRKVSTPSRNHLKKSHVNKEHIFGESKTGIIKNKNMSSLNDGKKVKLPPPPVPKKPNLKSIKNSNLSQEDNEKSRQDHIRLGDVTAHMKSQSDTHVDVNAKDAGRKKPEILPKPTFNGNSHTHGNSTSNGVTKKMEDSETPSFANKQSETQDQQSKVPLSFSERLKASSLSRKSDQNASDKTSTKLRSQIISPVRRGSRSYMNVDSLQEKDHTTKPVFSLFKRYSSENQMPKTDESMENKMQNEKGKSLQDEKKNNLLVEPLSVDSVLLTNSFEDENDSSKDSFDTGELSQNLYKENGFRADENLPENSSTNILEQNLISEIIQGTNLSSKASSKQIESQFDMKSSDDSQEHKADIEKQNFQKTLSLFDDNIKITNHKTGLESTKTNTSDNKQLTHNEVSQEQKEKNIMLDSPQGNKLPCSIFFNAKRLKSSNSKDGQNTRRKFKPIGSAEQDIVLSPTENPYDISKEEIIPDFKNEMEKENQDQINLINSLLESENFETDSSLEMVTPDIGLDSSCDVFHADGTSNVEAIAIDAEDDDIPVDEIISGFDPEMIPRGLPPPPVDLDSDDDFTLNIIDPPTVYDDDDDGAGSDNGDFDFDEADIPWIPENTAVNSDLKDSEQPIDFLDEMPSETISVSVEEDLQAPSRHESSRIKNDSQSEKITSEIPSYTDSGVLSSSQSVASLSSKFDALAKTSRHLQDEKRAQEIEDVKQHEAKEKSAELEVSYTEETTLFTQDVPLFDSDSEFERSKDLWGNNPGVTKPPPSVHGSYFDSKSGLDKNDDLEYDDDIGATVPPPLLPDPPEFDDFSESENEAMFSDFDEEETIPPLLPPKPALFDLSDFEDEPMSFKHELFDAVEPEGFQKDGNTNLNEITLFSERGIEFKEEYFTENDEFTLADLDLKSHSGLDSLMEGENISNDLDLSAKGRIRKRSFQLGDKRSEKSKSILSDTDRNTEDGNQEVIEFPSEGLPLLSEPEFDFIPSIPESLIEENRSESLSIQPKTKINISINDDTLVTDNITDNLSDICASQQSSTSSYKDALGSENFSPNKTLLTSTSHELQYPDQNKLSPASSVDYLPELDKLSSRRSSSSSMNRSDQGLNHRAVERHLSNRTWTSFNSSDDEETEGKKLNIVKLMKERTLSQDDGIDGVRLSFEDENKRIDGMYESEMESSPGFLQDDSMQKFENFPLDEWTVEDVGDWLEMIGFGDLKTKFEERHVGGLELMAIDFQLLDDMGITNPEDRELILSEIYALKNPEDVDVEMSLLDALDNASGYDREKMLAVLEALKMPSEDNDNNYLPPSPSPKLSPRNKKKSGKSRITNDKYRRAVSECLPEHEIDSLDERSKSASPTRNFTGSLAMSMAAGLSKVNATKEKKTSKKKSFLNAFSFRRKGSRKLGRLFSSRRKLVDSSLKYLLQASPQGVVKVLVHRSELESTFVPLLVTVNTTAAEITKTVLEKLEMIEDANSFYMVQAHTSKSVPEVKLGADECPLVLQCRWPDAERYRFEMKKKSDGSVIVVYGGEGLKEERSVKIETTLNTTCDQIMSIALKRLQLKEPVNCFSLLQMKNEKNRQTLEESQIPMDTILLTMTKNLSKPAVYRLLRVNFLGSPEGVPAQDNSNLEVIENLQEQVENLKIQLEHSSHTISMKQEEINDLRKASNDQTSLDKEKEVLNLKQSVEDMNARIRQLSESQNSAETTSVAVKEEFLVKLETKEKELTDLKSKIGDLENTLYAKEEEMRNSKDNQKKFEGQKEQANDDEMARMLTYEQSTNIEILENENKSLREAINELQVMLDVRDREIEDLTRAKHENEILNEKMKTFEKIMDKKDEQLQEMKNVTDQNEELQDRISVLERTLKQKDRAANEALSSQSMILELRRSVDMLQNEVIEKEDDLENSKQELLELRDKLNEDIELKIKTIENLMTEAQELRRQLSDTEQEKTELAIRLRELDLISEDRRKRIEELSDAHEEYKGQHQRIKKLERELTIRTEEIQQISNDKDASSEDLQNHIETLEQNLLDKGSTILDLEFKLQKIERRLKESEDAADEDLREKNRLSLAVDDLSQKTMELNKRLDNYKRLVVDKDKQIQTLKGSQNRADEKLNADFIAVQRELAEKDITVLQIKQKMDAERSELKSHFANLQELVASKDAKWKEREIQVNKEREDSKLRSAQLETRVSEKEAVIRKLEAKVAKLEVMGRENMKKFEKFMSDKDRMMKQVKENAEKDVKSLKEKLRKMDETHNENERQIRQLNRGSSIDQDVIAVKLKQKDEENKQNKYLLERLMSVVNDKDPNLLEQFENSFGFSPNKQNDKQPLLPKVDEDWC